MFKINTEDLNYIFESAGQSVLVNDVPMNAIISNPSISEFDQKYIHTLQRVSRGDMVTLENEKYICVTESLTKRGSKFKVLARHCNGLAEKRFYISVYIGNDSFGDPVYRDEYDHSEYVPAIVDNKSFSINSTSTWRYPENQIEVIVQDNETNRAWFGTEEKFTIADKWWMVLNQDYSKVGMIIMTCESTTAPIV